MKESIGLLNMFPDYVPPEALQEVLSQAALVAADIDPVTRRVSVEITANTYIPQRELEQVSGGIAASYGLNKLTIGCKYPEDQLCKIESDELRDLFVAQNPLTRGSLAGAQWNWKGNTLTVSLRANGKETLEKCVPAVCRVLQERFSAKVEIVFETGMELEGQALFDEMARMRSSVLTQIPMTAVAPEKKAIPAQSTNAILGKPFKGAAVPMQELNLDMGNVIVEGRVFHIDHKELKKRNAWVVI